MTMYTYAIQPSSYDTLSDGHYVPCMTFFQAEILANKEVRDTQRDHTIWKIPLGGQPMAWAEVRYNDPHDKPIENPGDDGDLMDYDSSDVI